MLTTLQSESHYLYFTDVGDEDQKSQVMWFITWLMSQNLNLVLSKSKSFALELQVIKHEGVIYLPWEE